MRSPDVGLFTISILYVHKLRVGLNSSIQLPELFKTVSEKLGLTLSLAVGSQPSGMSIAVTWLGLSTKAKQGYLTVITTELDSLHADLEILLKHNKSIAVFHCSAVCCKTFAICCTHTHWSWNKTTINNLIKVPLSLTQVIWESNPKHFKPHFQVV